MTLRVKLQTAVCGPFLQPDATPFEKAVNANWSAINLVLHELRKSFPVARDLVVVIDDRQDDEPRLLDVDLCKRVEYKNIRRLRHRIRELHSQDPENFNPLAVCSGSEQTSGGRPGTKFYLTEHEALFLISQINTEIARKLTHEMIRVYIAVRRGLLQQETPITSYRKEIERSVQHCTDAFSLAFPDVPRSTCAGWVRQFVLATHGVSGMPLDYIEQLPSMTVRNALHQLEMLCNELPRRRARKPKQLAAPEQPGAQLTLFDQVFHAGTTTVRVQVQSVA